MSSISILELDHNEARRFFLKHESYCNIDLPKYFSFTELLKEISTEITGKNLSGLIELSEMKKLDDINHLLYANKDGKLSWRPLQIIHPLVYVDLVHHITEKDNWKKITRSFQKISEQSKNYLFKHSCSVKNFTKRQSKTNSKMVGVNRTRIYFSFTYI